MFVSLRMCLPVSRFVKNSVTSTLVAEYRNRVYSTSRAQVQETVPDYTKINDELSREVFAKVNRQIDDKTHGRLFAIVHIGAFQYKITAEDILVIRHNWPPVPGDKIRLEKVLLVGSSDFTLVGRPLLPLDQVSVYATVIEKTFTQTIPRLLYRPRKNDLRCKFFKDQLTYIRITNINLTGKVNELGMTDGLKDRIF